MPHEPSTTEALTLGAMMAALSALLFVTVRAPVVVVACSFPLIHVGLRCGARTAARTAAVASCVVAMLLGPAMGLHFAVPFGVTGTLLGWLLRRPVFTFRHLFLVATVTGGALLAKVAVLLWLMGKTGGIQRALDTLLRLNAGFLQALLEPLQHLFPAHSAAGETLGFLCWSWGPEFHRVLGQSLLEAPVGLAIAVSLSDAFVTLLFAVEFFRRMGLETPRAPRPADFRVRPAALLALAVCHLLVLSRFRGASPAWAWIGANGLVVVGLAFYTAALGALQDAFERRWPARASAFPLVWLIAIPLYPLAMLAGAVVAATSGQSSRVSGSSPSPVVGAPESSLR